jgi:hypothetical protein
MNPLEVNELSERGPLAEPLHSKARPLFQFAMSLVFSFGRVCIPIRKFKEQPSPLKDPGKTVERRTYHSLD